MYYTPQNNDQQRLLSPSLSSPGISSGHASPLKPLHILSHSETPADHPDHDPTFPDPSNPQQASRQDALLKSRIRHLRLLTRTLSFLISLGVLIPISMTLVKYLSTRTTFRPIALPNGETKTRTAWAQDSKTWPTYTYFAVALLSSTLHCATLLSHYFGTTAHGNTASYITSAYTWIELAGNLVVWGVAAGMYRAEKDRGGKSNDLWGWTCSAAARAVQKEFAQDVDFNAYCEMQSVSFYVGCVQVGNAVVVVGTYGLVWMRWRARKRVVGGW